MSVYRFPPPPRSRVESRPCLYEVASRYCTRGRCARCDTRRMTDRAWRRAVAELALVVGFWFSAGALVGWLARGCG